MKQPLFNETQVVNLVNRK